MEGSQKWRHRQTSKYVFGFVVSTSQSDMADRDVRKTEKAQKMKSSTLLTLTKIMWQHTRYYALFRHLLKTSPFGNKWTMAHFDRLPYKYSYLVVVQKVFYNGGLDIHVIVKSAINSLLWTVVVSSSSVSDTDPVSDSEPLPDFSRGLFFVFVTKPYQVAIIHQLLHMPKTLTLHK